MNFLNLFGTPRNRPESYESRVIDDGVWDMFAQMNRSFASASAAMERDSARRDECRKAQLHAPYNLANFCIRMMEYRQPIEEVLILAQRYAVDLVTRGEDPPVKSCYAEPVKQMIFEAVKEATIVHTLGRGDSDTSRPFVRGQIASKAANLLGEAFVVYRQGNPR